MTLARAYHELLPNSFEETSCPGSCELCEGNDPARSKERVLGALYELYYASEGRASLVKALACTSDGPPDLQDLAVVRVLQSCHARPGVGLISALGGSRARSLYLSPYLQCSLSSAVILEVEASLDHQVFGDGGSISRKHRSCRLRTRTRETPFGRQTATCSELCLPTGYYPEVTEELDYEYTRVFYNFTAIAPTASAAVWVFQEFSRGLMGRRGWLHECVGRLRPWTNFQLTASARGGYAIEKGKALLSPQVMIQEKNCRSTDYSTRLLRVDDRNAPSFVDDLRFHIGQGENLLAEYLKTGCPAAREALPRGLSTWTVSKDSVDKRSLFHSIFRDRFVPD